MNWTKLFRKEKKYITHKTTDLYEASYLILKGAKLQSVKTKFRRAKKDVFLKRFVVFLQRVDKEELNNWKHRKATGDVREYANIRKNIKRECKLLI